MADELEIFKSYSICQPFCIEYLEWANILCYHGRHHINFDSANDFSVILSDRSKNSIIEILMFALYEKFEPNQGLISKYISGSNNSDIYVLVVLRTGDSSIWIKRTITAKGICITRNSHDLPPNLVYSMLMLNCRCVDFLHEKRNLFQVINQLLGFGKIDEELINLKQKIFKINQSALGAKYTDAEIVKWDLIQLTNERLSIVADLNEASQITIKKNSIQAEVTAVQAKINILLHTIEQTEHQIASITGELKIYQAEQQICSLELETCRRNIPKALLREAIQQFDIKICDHCIQRNNAAANELAKIIDEAVPVNPINSIESLQHNYMQCREQVCQRENRSKQLSEHLSQSKSKLSELYDLSADLQTRLTDISSLSGQYDVAQLRNKLSSIEEKIVIKHTYQANNFDEKSKLSTLYDRLASPTARRRIYDNTLTKIMGAAVALAEKVPTLHLQPLMTAVFAANQYTAAQPRVGLSSQLLGGQEIILEIILRRAVLAVLMASNILVIDIYQDCAGEDWLRMMLQAIDLPIFDMKECASSKICRIGAKYIKFDEIFKTSMDMLGRRRMVCALCQCFISNTACSIEKHTRSKRHIKKCQLVLL